MKKIFNPKAKINLKIGVIILFFLSLPRVSKLYYKEKKKKKTKLEICTRLIFPTSHQLSKSAAIYNRHHHYKCTSWKFRLYWNKINLLGLLLWAKSCLASTSLIIHLLTPPRMSSPKWSQSKGNELSLPVSDKPPFIHCQDMRRSTCSLGLIGKCG